MGAAWNDIDGTFLNEDVTQWSKGEYRNANNRQDDLAIIANPATNGFGYRADDKGNTRATATALKFVGGAVSDSGIIERTSDVDWFVFTTSGGQVILSVTVLDVNSRSAPQPGANLAVALQLADETGAVLHSAHPTDTLSARISAPLAAGTYYLRVEGAGRGTAATGFTDYASLGAYSITGLAPQEGVDVLAVAPAAREIPEEGGEFDFEVISNQDWTWSSDAAWVTSEETGHQTGHQTFHYTVEANPEVTSRTAIITLSAGGLTATHHLTQAGATPDDHGDTLATATLIAPGSTTEGELETPGDEDVFRIEITTPGLLVAETTGSTDTYGYLLDATGEELARNDDSSGTNFRLAHAVAAGTYYVRVRHYSSFGTGAYRLVCSLDTTPVLSVSPVSRNVSDAGGSYSFNVSANVTWSWDGGADWITGSEAVSQNGSQLFEYTVAPNATGIARSAIILLAGDGLSAAHTVTQSGAGIDDHGDTPATATVIEPDSTTAGWIDPENDVDYFRLDIPEAGVLLVRTLGDIDTYGTLFDADGRVVTENDDGDTNLNFRIFRRIAAGVYYIEVRHYDLFGTGFYQLVSQFTPGQEEDDHGDTSTTATVIEPDSTTAGWIDPEGDVDYFRIEVPTAGMLEVRTFGGIDTYGTLYDADSRIVTENDDDDFGYNFLISRHVAAGVYYIEVRHYDLFGTGSYQLVSQFTPGEGGDDHGDTLATATVIEPDSTTAGRIDPEGDVDYFRVEVPTAGTLEVRTLGGIDTYGTLYDADGRVVTENDDDDFGDTGYNFLISRRVAAGVYYIEVRHYRLLGTGPYQLVSRFTPGEGGDDHGDTLATATVIEPDSTTAGRIDPAADVDCFRIEIPTAGTIEVRSSSNFDTYGALFNANGDFITESDDEGDGRDFRISWEVAPGVYFVEVSHFSFSATGAYQLISRFEPAGEPLITDHPADATLIAGESHTLRVQAEGDGISYQWYVGAVGDTSTPIDGATGPVLEIAPVTTLSYWVWVGAAGGSQDSAGATVTVDTTPAGGTWTGVASGVASTLRDVAWLGDLFVAVGDGGVILTSPDGVTWTSQASGIGQPLESVAWNGNEYVAVGAQGAVVSSTDGVIWTARHSGTSAELNGVAWNGTAFWAVGPAGSVRHSPDGRSWSESAANVPELYNIHALDGVLCAVGPDNLLTSSDGTLWTPRLSTSDLFYDSVTSNGQDWLTVGSDGAVRLSSDRGATWTPAQIVADTWLRGAASDGSGFVVVGNAGAIYTSPQGAVWTRRDSGGDGILHAVAWNGRCYVAVGENGRILRSTGAWSGAAASTYAQWAASWGLTEGAGAPTADWDGDETPNVLEFITGARPGDPAPRALAYPSVSFDPIADQVTVTYPFNPRSAGLEAGVQVNTDLSHWGDVFPTISSDGSGYTEWHRVVLSRSLFPTASFRFTYRLP